MNPSSRRERSYITVAHYESNGGAVLGGIQLNTLVQGKCFHSNIPQSASACCTQQSKHSEAQSPRIHLYPKNTQCYIQTQLHSCTGVGDSLMSGFNVSGRWVSFIIQELSLAVSGSSLSCSLHAPHADMCHASHAFPSMEKRKERDREQMYQILITITIKTWKMYIFTFIAFQTFQLVGFLNCYIDRHLT